jgi:hypothetical protein
MNVKVVNDANQPVIIKAAPVATGNAGNDTTQTSAAGSAYVVLAAHPARQVTIVNNTGTSIDVQYVSGGAAFPIPTGSMMTFQGIINSNQLQLKRTDNAVTQVTVAWNWQN